MKRGMITFTQEEIAYFQTLLPVLNNPPAELATRLNAAQQTHQNPTAIELSQESVETLLDALPAPTSERTNATEIRTKLNHFLQQ